MKYVALLRGINVGTSIRINMKSLKALFENNGFIKVSTYINSGNIIFESVNDEPGLQNKIESFLFNELNQEIHVLVFDKDKIQNIAKAIPAEWSNDENQKTDVAYLFDEINNSTIVDEFPVRKEYIRLLYVNGALIWNVAREDYNRSQLNKIISHKIYKKMTVRNVNTARYLASVM